MPNKKIKVSEATVAKLRKGTMAGNLAKAKGASPEMREALMRFYGAKRVNAAISKATTPSPGPGGRVAAKPRGGPGAKMAKTSASPSVKPMGRAQTKQATYDKALKSARAQAAADRKKGMK